MSKVKLVERWYDHNGYRALQIEGEKFGDLEAIEQVGFLGNMAAWKFRCVCGKEIIRRAAHIVYAFRHPGKSPAIRLNCGCKSKRQLHGLKGHVVQKWNLLKRKGLLCERWAADCRVFKAECWDSKSGPCLIRPDDTKPLGPDNFQWSNHGESYWRTLEESVRSAMSLKGITEQEARAWVETVSRQRRDQLLNKYYGLCIMCGEPRVPDNANYCDKCRAKNNSSKTRKLFRDLAKQHQRSGRP